MTSPSKISAATHSFNAIKPQKVVNLLFWLLILTGLLLGVVIFSHMAKGIGDEDVHSFQIGWFVQGRFEIFKYIPMIPTYHACVAALSKVFGFIHQHDFRFAHTLLVSLSIPAFYWLSCRLNSTHKSADDAPLRSAQFFLTPIYIPWFFLLYTDMFSVLFCFLMFERTLAKQYWAAGILALIAVMVRTPNVIWVAYACTLVLLENGNIQFNKTAITRYITQDIKKIWPFLLVFGLFITFVVINGGVAIGDAQQHPVSFNLSNLYFFLLVVFLLFLPYHISNTLSIKTLLAQHYWIYILLAIGFLVYWNTYEHPHKYNTPALDYYRHNWVLHYSCDFILGKLLTFIAMSWASLSLGIAALKSQHTLKMLWMFPFAALSFVPLPLIEQRYYTMALCLFLLMRPAVSLRVSLTTLLYYCGLSGYIIYNISHAKFIL